MTQHLTSRRALSHRAAKDRLHRLTLLTHQIRLTRQTLLMLSWMRSPGVSLPSHRVMVAMLTS